MVIKKKNGINFIPTLSENIKNKLKYLAWEFKDKLTDAAWEIRDKLEDMGDFFIRNAREPLVWLLTALVGGNIGLIGTGLVLGAYDYQIQKAGNYIQTEIVRRLDTVK